MIIFDAFIFAAPLQTHMSLEKDGGKPSLWDEDMQFHLIQFHAFLLPWGLGIPHLQLHT